MFSSATQTIRSYITSILGTYTPQTITIDGSTVALQGVASLDWSYIFTGILLVIVVYCLFRALGYLFTRIF